MAEHLITWHHDREDIVGEMACSAPTGAECRLTCPSGCESWPCGLDLVDGGNCNPIEWAEASADPLLTFNGPDGSMVRSGPIVFEWQGDYYTWDYAPLDGNNG